MKSYQLFAFIILLLTGVFCAQSRPASQPAHTSILSQVNIIRDVADTPLMFSISLELTNLANERIAMEEEAEEIATIFGPESSISQQYLDAINQTDLINGLKLISILRSYGWLGIRQLGNNGAESLKYLYFHLDVNDQKKYYPLISVAFKNNVIDAKCYAQITDSLSLTDKGYQIFGTVDNKPVLTPDSLVNRRTSIGLE